MSLRWTFAVAAALFVYGTMPLFALPSTTTVTASSAQVDPGTAVTFTATVSPGPSGGVIFSEGQQQLATVFLVNGVASWTTSSLTPGLHTIVGTLSSFYPYEPSSGSVQVLVNNPAPQVLSVTPSHLAAGRLDTMIWIRGDWFHVGTSVKVNGATIRSHVDRRTLLRAILPPSALANAGPLTIEIVNSGVNVSASTSTTFTVDPPGPPPLALVIGTSTVTASPVTVGGWSALLGLSATPLGPAAFQTYTFSSPLVDDDRDGVVVFDGFPPGHQGSFAPLTAISVVDLTTGAERVDVPPGAVRNETFMPLSLVSGMRDGLPTCLSPGTFSYGGVLIRPGVGSWQSFGVAADAVYPSSFSFNVGSGPPPPAFEVDDVIILFAADTTFARARLGDYLPVADPSTPSLLLEDTSAAEGSSGTSSLEFPLRLTSASSSPVTVHYATADDSATAAGGDYTPVQGDVTFAPGELLKTISVPVNGDTLYEHDERVRLTLSDASGAPILLGNGHGLIVNDDPAPRVSIGDVTIAEGTGGQKVVAFPVTLSEASSLSSAIHYRLQRGTTDGVEAVLDLSPTVTVGAFVIPAGATQATVAVRIAGDDIDEDDEQFYIDLTFAPESTIERSRGTGTILDDDDPPSLTIADSAVVEGTGADRTINLPVTLSHPSGRAITIDYQLVGGSAAAGTDFVAAGGTLVVSGATPVLPVTIKADAVREQKEAFSIVLGQPVNVTLARATLAVTIADDDGESDAYASAVLADQPAVYYRLDEPDGGIAHDASGHLRDGAYGSAFLHDVPGAIGTGNPAIASRTGAVVNNQIAAPSDWLTAGMPEATLEGWVQGGEGSATLLHSDGAVSLELSSTSAAIHSADDQLIAFSMPVLAAGWHHLALVAKSGASALYVDGQAVATSTTAFAGVGPPSAVLNSTSNDSALDELAGYAHALSAEAIARHFAARSGVHTSADFNADGSNDLVLRNPSTGANAFWLLNGTAYGSTVNLPWLPSDFRIEGAADFDGDGQHDLVLRNYANGNNALWLMNGTAIKAIVNLPWLPVTSDFRFEGTGDMNGDGSPDLLIRNYTNGNNAVWLLDGTSLAGVVNLPALPDANYRMAGSGDFNADGKADIVWRNQATGSNAVWLMSGTSLLGIANLPTLTNTAYRFNAIADYDGDGQPDIALRNYTTGANAFWLLNGTALKGIVNLPALPNTAYEIMGPR
jgi:hypothetical protein